MRADSITLAIEEKYTPEEKAEIAGKLATAIADRAQVKLDKSASDAAFNERLKKHEAEIEDLAKRYNKGCEVAQIGCDIKYDTPEPGKKSYVRFDNGEVAEVHDMNWEEKQETIQFPLAEQKPPCEHPSVSSSEGIWKCDSCGETLTPPEIGNEKPLDIIGPDLPPDEPNAAGAGA